MKQKRNPPLSHPTPLMQSESTGAHFCVKTNIIFSLLINDWSILWQNNWKGMWFEWEQPFVKEGACVTRKKTAVKETSIAGMVCFFICFDHILPVIGYNAVFSIGLITSRLFRKWDRAPPPNRRLDAWVCYCQLRPIRSLPVQIKQAA